MLKLLINEEDRVSLLRTMEAFTFAFDTSAKWGYHYRTCNRIRNHHGTYHKIRSEIPELNSGLVQSARDCACEALKRVKLKKLPSRKPHASIRYNKNSSRIVMEHGFVNISTIAGRKRFNFNQSKYIKKFVGWRVINSVLVYDNRVKDFFLGVSVEKPDPPIRSEGVVLGIDRGLRNLVVSSDNRFFDSRKMNRIRGKYAHKRKVLQTKGTRSAKKKLKALAGREKRFIACENHILSKAISQSGHDIFALEDLKGIKRNRRMDTRMKTQLNQWPLSQFSEFLKYKALELGKAVIFVDPYLTSRMCSRCGHECRENRKGGEFKCLACGFQLNADLNAARNIAEAGKSCISRLPVNQPNASCSEGRTLKWDSGVAEHRCKHLIIGRS
jgi:putative transposase